MTETGKTGPGPQCWGDSSLLEGCWCQCLYPKVSSPVSGSIALGLEGSYEFPFLCSGVLSPWNAISSWVGSHGHVGVSDPMEGIIRGFRLGCGGVHRTAR